MKCLFNLLRIKGGRKGTKHSFNIMMTYRFLHNHPSSLDVTDSIKLLYYDLYQSQTSRPLRTDAYKYHTGNGLY